MMDTYFKVSIWVLLLLLLLLLLLKATLSSLKKKKKERCDFITKHLTDFAMLYVVSLGLIM